MLQDITGSINHARNLKTTAFKRTKIRGRPQSKTVKNDMSDTTPWRLWSNGECAVESMTFMMTKSLKYSGNSSEQALQQKQPISNTPYSKSTNSSPNRRCNVMNKMVGFQKPKLRAMPVQVMEQSDRGDCDPNIDFRIDLIRKTNTRNEQKKYGLPKQRFSCLMGVAEGKTFSPYASQNATEGNDNTILAPAKKQYRSYPKGAKQSALHSFSPRSESNTTLMDLHMDKNRNQIDDIVGTKDTHQESLHSRENICQFHNQTKQRIEATKAKRQATSGGKNSFISSETFVSSFNEHNGKEQVNRTSQERAVALSGHSDQTMHVMKSPVGLSQNRKYVIEQKTRSSSRSKHNTKNTESKSDATGRSPQYNCQIFLNGCKTLDKNSWTAPDTRFTLSDHSIPKKKSTAQLLAKSQVKSNHSNFKQNDDILVHGKIFSQPKEPKGDKVSSQQLSLSPKDTKSYKTKKKASLGDISIDFLVQDIDHLQMNQKDLSAKTSDDNSRAKDTKKQEDDTDLLVLIDADTIIPVNRQEGKTFTAPQEPACVLVLEECEGGKI